MSKYLVPFLTLVTGSTAANADTINLSSLDISKAIQGWETPRANRSVGNNELAIAGQKFQNGLGTHASGLLWVDLKKSASRLTTKVGVDDEAEAERASIEFIVYGDERVLWRSGIMRRGDAAKPVDIDLTGVQTLLLRVTDAGDGNNNDHADWVDAVITHQGEAPVAIASPVSQPVILTPKPKPAPRINGPKLFGVRPGSPFLYLIPATGNRPMSFSARGLPKGLQLDSKTGRISGRLTKTGTYQVTLQAKNPLGTAKKPFKIVVGEQIQLTPPMGYNSWNCWGPQVDQDKMMRSARAMIANGLDRHGWNYVNIDDAWQGLRGGPLNAIQPNEKFPDMKGFVDQVHAMGLKAGIYSSPWLMTYDGHQGGSSNDPAGTWEKTRWTLGKYFFEQNDAQQWANWGMDYLKYDWNPISLRETKAMHDALRATKRDIVLSLSNSTRLSDIEQLAPHAELWRTTGDITDSWESMSGIGFNQDAWAASHRVSKFGDPDMLVVGEVFGWAGYGHPANTHPTRLTPDEQYTHISLWSLLGAPLLIGCDMEKLDPFTLNLLTNDEVIDIDQDSFGKQAVCIWKGGEENELNIYSKPLDDGSIAVGLFNRGPFTSKIAAEWKTLGLTKSQVVRDVWRQQDIGKFNDRFEATVPSHGVVLLKLTPTK
jgi:alpha-galactosidase